MASQYRHRRICAVPLGIAKRLNEQLYRQGFGPQTFSVPLRTNGGTVPGLLCCDIALTDWQLSLLTELLANYRKPIVNAGPLGTRDRRIAARQDLDIKPNNREQ